jgi:hypothetical protein
MFIFSCFKEKLAKFTLEKNPNKIHFLGLKMAIFCQKKKSQCQPFFLLATYNQKFILKSKSGKLCVF